MRVLLVLLFLPVADQGLSSTLGNQVRLLVGKTFSRSKAKEIVNIIDENGRNALHHAAIIGNLELSRFFLDADVDTLAKDNHGLLPYDYLVKHAEDPDNHRNGSYALIASYVLEKMPSSTDNQSRRRAGRGGIHQRDNKGWTPLVWAIIARDKARINELLDAGAEVIDAGVDWTSTRQGIFKIAEIIGDQQITELLIEKLPGRDVAKALAEAVVFNVSDDFFHAVARAHDVDPIIIELLQEFAQARTLAGRPIETRYRSYEMIENIVASFRSDRSLSLDYVFHKSIIHSVYATKEEVDFSLMIAQVMINRGLLDLDKKGIMAGLTPLMRAAYHGLLEIVEFLLANGANKEVRVTRRYQILRGKNAREIAEVALKTANDTTNDEDLQERYRKIIALLQ